ncbi:hypothetical protein FO440_11910 [Mucilaginibacter corticis]|uniref:Carboxypeptidase-like regulatory domain-containing protein n=1 Tax=Mucilaginibacter corticis TaxID=2597670 RepID=A0A556MKL5_9SPHI|nr:hypothetical protein [Mucilaginibacter corticis]TSJ40454.1 hypothetical protein FO440_11910 [Mucilaginibacter corticis]
MKLKILFTLLICSFALQGFAQQKLNTFYIIDSSTKKATPFVSVTILRARLSITTEKDGIFIIPGDLATMRDTVVFAAQNYDQLKIPINSLAYRDTIQLTRNEIAAGVVSQKYTTDTLLNDFDKNEIWHYAGFDTETANFDYYQLAQKFEAPKTGARVEKVKVARLAFNDQGEGYERVAYRLRFYDVDPNTLGPGKELTGKTIEISNGEDRQSGVSLSKYNIIIPQKSFFVAIEWLRSSHNLGHVISYDKKRKVEVSHDNYRPAIGIAPKTGKTLNMWALNFKHQWQPYTYFMPFGTDLAIKATVEY